MTATKKPTMREAFERWAKRRGDTIERRGRGYYTMYVDWEWAAWQAAWRNSKRRT